MESACTWLSELMYDFKRERENVCVCVCVCVCMGTGVLVSFLLDGLFIFDEVTSNIYTDLTIYFLFHRCSICCPCFSVANKSAIPSCHNRLQVLLTLTVLTAWPPNMCVGSQKVLAGRISGWQVLTWLVAQHVLIGILICTVWLVF